MQFVLLENTEFQGNIDTQSTTGVFKLKDQGHKTKGAEGKYSTLAKSLRASAPSRA